jgi:hypothetical protein
MNLKELMEKWWFWLIVIVVVTVTILSLPIYNCHMGWVDYHCHSL